MSYYIPDFIPDEDKEMLLKYQSGKVRRVGFGKKPAIIVVDMNRAFVEDRFPSGCSKTGIPAVNAIKRLLEAGRRSRVTIIYTTGIRTEEINNLAVRGRWMDKSSPLPKELLVKADEIYPDIAPQKGDIILKKAKPSAFFGTQLISILNFLDIDTLIISGMTTSGCVRATVVDAFSYNYRVIVPRECVADRIKISHEVALFDIDMKYGDVVKLDEVVEYLESSRKKLEPCVKST
jgi:nicotinamidase-related amidase